MSATRINNSNQTIRKMENLRYLWKINNISSLVDKTNEYDYIKSPAICDEIYPQIKWNFILYPKGIPPKKKNTNVWGISLHLCNPVEYDICGFWSVKIDNLELTSKRTIQCYDGEVYHQLGIHQINNNFKDESNLSIDDILIVECKIIYSVAPSIKLKKSRIQFDKPTSPPLKRLRKSEIQLNKPTLDLSKIFGNTKFSDIVLIAEGNEYPAHKVVLSSASPIFWEMFENDTKNEISTIVIQDATSKIIEEMLRHIYLNEVENLSNIAHELIVIANKYILKNLQVLCEQTMVENLTMDNLLDLLLIANANNCEILQDRIYELFAQHKVEISQTPDFNSVMVSHPLLIAKLLQKCIN